MSPRPSHASTGVLSRTGVTAIAAGVAVAAAALLGVGAAAFTRADDGNAIAGEPTAVPSPTPSVSAPPPPPPSPTPSPSPVDLGPIEFTFVAAGDVLPHSSVVASGRSGNSYDFGPMFAGVTPFISGADLALCHMEVPVSPTNTPTGYPIFGTVKELVWGLDESGWDGCSTASNHTVDRGFDGVVATLEAFDSVRMGTSGSARSAEEAPTQIYSVRRGPDVVKIAHISYSYGTNGLPVPSGRPYSVNLFNANASEAAPIIAAAEAARADGADIVIASVHCCVEYRVEPTSAQRLLVEKIAASGAVDLYVGHHAHVPQPIEKLPGGPNGDGMWAAFGLGNFVSNQGTQCCVALTEVGVFLTATFTVPEDGPVTVDAEWTGTTVDRLGGHKVYVLRDIQDGVGRISASEAKARLERVRGAVGDAAPERTTPPETLSDGTYPDSRLPWSPST